ncbi:NAD-dependent epimerase/dehydratase family protein [Agromyces sp. CFH 90414]|uniref:NAD-dependent epimerase/dehydratase family protein n=1 Tax=Agromyces agglutinans TaxID=2662258 RepID=A0A6I2F5S8_9MICO|nr:NAD(P)-dependent oxidoreductase [Agromyces agglutinans]MRG59949.1 NAD-dependent epimerase/dehydratase family protein [Agromyces agglutinans]
MPHPDDAPQVVAITGASGRIGRLVVPLLERPGRTLQLVDTDLPDRVDDGPWGEWSDPARVELHRASIEDEDAIRSALDGADAVVHLAALASERPWVDLVRVNIDGTQKVLEAARLGGARRVLLASSIHAIGFADATDAATTRVLVPRPDTYYGVSKATLEALGSVYADRFGMSVVSARICAFGAEPGRGRGLVQWLSPADAARLFEAAIALDDGRHHIVWGVSASGAGSFDLSAGRAIGFEPQDDAIAHTTERDGVAPEVPRAAGPVGGSFTDDDHPLGGSW